MTFKPAGYGFYCNSGDMSSVPIAAYVAEIHGNYEARYNALCTAFHECQRLYCEEITRQQAANLRKKRQLRGLRSGIRSQRSLTASVAAKRDAKAEGCREASKHAAKAMGDRDDLRARVANLTESLHLADGTANLALRHRDIAERRVAELEKKLEETHAQANQMGSRFEFQKQRNADLVADLADVRRNLGEIIEREAIEANDVGNQLSALHARVSPLL